MVRILGDRATGKTTSLLYQAEELAKAHPDETIYFVGSHNLETRYGDRVSKNIKFITPMAFLHIKSTPSSYVVIDEVESFLGRLGVRAYSLSLSDRNLYKE